MPWAKTFCHTNATSVSNWADALANATTVPCGHMKTSTGVIAALLEFVECLIHQLLHLRKLYSTDLFEKQRLYGIAVHRSRHPDLNDYISTVVESLQVLQLLMLMLGCEHWPPPPSRGRASHAPQRTACRAPACLPCEQSSTFDLGGEPNA